MIKILKNDVLFKVFILLILSLILFLPISPDLCIYITSGKLIAEGKFIYSDMIDIKPPLFYYFYSIIYRIFGNGEFQVRLFDYLYQVLTIFYLYKLSNKLFENKTIAKLTAVCYATAYACVTYRYSMHAESFIGLFVVLLIWNILYGKSKFQYVFIGLLLGLLFAFKYSMLLVALAVAIYLVIENKTKINELIKNYAIIFTAFLVPIFFSYLVVMNPIPMKGFLLTLDFTKYYAGVVPYNFSFIRIMYNDTLVLFSDKYSITFTLGLLLSYFFVIKKQNVDLNKSFLLVNLILIALFISYLIERKFSYMHFVRMYSVFSLLTAFGLYNFIKELNTKQEYDFYVKYSKVLVFAILFFASNVNRLIYQMVPAYYAIANPVKYNKFYTDEGTGGNRNNYFAVVEYLKMNQIKSDYLICGTAPLLINYFYNDNNYSAFPQSTYFLSHHKVKEWEQKAITEMTNVKVLIIENDDRVKGITGYNESTLERMKQLPIYANLLNTKFTLDTTILNFTIYKAK